MSFLCPNEPINEALITAARNSPHQVVYVKPTKTQLKILNQIRQGESVTASLIAERCDLSVSFASTLLKGLYEKRFLQRMGGAHQTGGMEFSYLLGE
ncbi:MarR family transcriptional regulator [Vibrio sp. JC009]|uniref:MarR family transcriptional regulator n=1 Tax=Vibrio sp. JC009 TaxID=2912314 RepID=UPI0023AE934F|nr:helix-turn-helix domain-containing protein [Vibrio sp. JC009]WED23091.1 MarR family transcriptional regulator [Vibrio sp. JC009]